MRLKDFLVFCIKNSPSFSAAARLLGVANPTPQTWLKVAPPVLDGLERAADFFGYEIIIQKKTPAPRD
jgi:hypothetical protein